MVALAAAIGVFSGVTGAVLSSMVPRLPTGPTIVLVLSTLVVLSLVFAPGRGLLWRWIKLGRLQPAAALDPVLMHLYALAQQHPDELDHGHGVGVLRTMSPAGADIEGALEELSNRGLVQPIGDELWAPTAIGRREAERTIKAQSETAS